MEPRSTHPLDIELLSVATGDADAALVSEVEEHLGTCLLCRIHMARLRRSGITSDTVIVPTMEYPAISAEVLSVLDGRDRPAMIEPGQVWLAGGPRRIAVWIDDIDTDDNVASVFAASLDVGAADDTSLIKRIERLDRDIAVFTSIGGTVTLDQLELFVDNLAMHDEIDGLIQALDDGTTADGLRVGPPILGGTDERLEFRQLLADDLAALDPVDDQDDESSIDSGNETIDEFDRVVADMRAHLSSEVSSRRGALCHVQTFDHLVEGSYPRTARVWPIANVQELNCRVLIVTSESGPDWPLDHPNDAYRLVLSAGASTLAVASPSEPYETQLYEHASLRDSYELPDAQVRVQPHALWEAKPLTKALFEYLESSMFKVDADSSPKVTAPGSPTIAVYLASHAQFAIDSLRKIRATLGKNRALKNLSDSDADEVARALVEEENLQAVLTRINELADQ